MREQSIYFEPGTYFDGVPRDELDRTLDQAQQLITQAEAGYIPRGFQYRLEGVGFHAFFSPDGTTYSIHKDNLGGMDLTRTRPVGVDEAGITRERLQLRISNDSSKIPTMVHSVVRGGAPDVMPAISKDLNLDTLRDFAGELDGMLISPVRAIHWPRRIFDKMFRHVQRQR